MKTQINSVLHIFISLMFLMLHPVMCSVRVDYLVINVISIGVNYPPSLDVLHYLRSCVYIWSNVVRTIPPESIANRSNYQSYARSRAMDII